MHSDIPELLLTESAAHLPCRLLVEEWLNVTCVKKNCPVELIRLSTHKNEQTELFFYLLMEIFQNTV